MPLALNLGLDLGLGLGLDLGLGLALGLGLGLALGLGLGAKLGVGYIPQMLGKFGAGCRAVQRLLYRSGVFLARLASLWEYRTAIDKRYRAGQSNMAWWAQTD